MSRLISKNLNLPKIKKKEIKDNLQSVDINHRDAQNLLQDISKTCLDIDFIKDYQVKEVQMVHNPLLEENFFKKKTEMKDSGRNAQSLVEQLGFMCIRSPQKSQILKEGLKTKKISAERIGKGELGIYLNRYFDVEVRSMWLKMDATTVIDLIVFKYITGRCKAITINNLYTTSSTLEPTPNYDSHVSSVQPTSQDSNFVQRARSSIYLYEYTDDCEPSNSPRQCLPFAIMKLKKRLTTKPADTATTTTAASDNRSASSLKTFQTPSLPVTTTSSTDTNASSSGPETITSATLLPMNAPSDKPSKARESNKTICSTSPAKTDSVNKMSQHFHSSHHKSKLHARRGPRLEAKFSEDEDDNADVVQHMNKGSKDHYLQRLAKASAMVEEEKNLRLIKSVEALPPVIPLQPLLPQALSASKKDFTELSVRAVMSSQGNNPFLEKVNVVCVEGNAGLASHQYSNSVQNQVNNPSNVVKRADPRLAKRSLSSDISYSSRDPRLASQNKLPTNEEASNNSQSTSSTSSHGPVTSKGHKNVYTEAKKKMSYSDYKKFKIKRLPTASSTHLIADSKLPHRLNSSYCAVSSTPTSFSGSSNSSSVTSSTMSSHQSLQTPLSGSKESPAVWKDSTQVTPSSSGHKPGMADKVSTSRLHKKKKLLPLPIINQDGSTSSVLRGFVDGEIKEIVLPGERLSSITKPLPDKTAQNDTNPSPVVKDKHENASSKSFSLHPKKSGQPGSTVKNPVESASSPSKCKEPDNTLTKADTVKDKEMNLSQEDVNTPAISDLKDNKTLGSKENEAESSQAIGTAQREKRPGDTSLALHLAEKKHPPTQVSCSSTKSSAAVSASTTTCVPPLKLIPFLCDDFTEEAPVHGIKETVLQSGSQKTSEESESNESYLQCLLDQEAHIKLVPLPYGKLLISSQKKRKKFARLKEYTCYLQALSDDTYQPDVMLVDYKQAISCGQFTEGNCKICQKEFGTLHMNSQEQRNTENSENINGVNISFVGMGTSEIDQIKDVSKVLWSDTVSESEPELNKHDNDILKDTQSQSKTESNDGVMQESVSMQLQNDNQEVANNTPVPEAHVETEKKDTMKQIFARIEADKRKALKKLVKYGQQSSHEGFVDENDENALRDILMEEAYGKSLDNVSKDDQNAEVKPISEITLLLKQKLVGQTSEGKAKKPTVFKKHSSQKVLDAEMERKRENFKQNLSNKELKTSDTSESSESCDRQKRRSDFIGNVSSSEAKTSKKDESAKEKLSNDLSVIGHQDCLSADVLGDDAPYSPSGQCETLDITSNTSGEHDDQSMFKAQILDGQDRLEEISVSKERDGAHCSPSLSCKNVKISNVDQCPQKINEKAVLKSADTLTCSISALVQKAVDVITCMTGSNTSTVAVTSTTPSIQRKESSQSELPIKMTRKFGQAESNFVSVVKTKVSLGQSNVFDTFAKESENLSSSSGFAKHMTETNTSSKTATLNTSTVTAMSNTSTVTATSHTPTVAATSNTSAVAVMLNTSTATAVSTLPSIHRNEGSTSVSPITKVIESGKTETYFGHQSNVFDAFATESESLCSTSGIVHDTIAPPNGMKEIKDRNSKSIIHLDNQHEKAHHFRMTIPQHRNRNIFAAAVSNENYAPVILHRASATLSLGDFPAEREDNGSGGDNCWGNTSCANTKMDISSMVSSVPFSFHDNFHQALGDVDYRIPQSATFSHRTQMQDVYSNCAMVTKWTRNNFVEVSNIVPPNVLHHSLADENGDVDYRKGHPSFLQHSLPALHDKSNVVESFVSNKDKASFNEKNLSDSEKDVANNSACEVNQIKDCVSLVENCFNVPKAVVDYGTSCEDNPIKIADVNNDGCFWMAPPRQTATSSATTTTTNRIPGLDYLNSSKESVDEDELDSTSTNKDTTSTDKGETDIQLSEGDNDDLQTKTNEKVSCDKKSRSKSKNMNPSTPPHQNVFDNKCFVQDLIQKINNSPTASIQNEHRCKNILNAFNAQSMPSGMNNELLGQNTVGNISTRERKLYKYKSDSGENDSGEKPGALKVKNSHQSTLGRPTTGNNIELPENVVNLLKEVTQSKKDYLMEGSESITTPSWLKNLMNKMASTGTDTSKENAKMKDDSQSLVNNEIEPLSSIPRSPDEIKKEVLLKCRQDNAKENVLKDEHMILIHHSPSETDPSVGKYTPEKEIFSVQNLTSTSTIRKEEPYSPDKNAGFHDEKNKKMNDVNDSTESDVNIQPKLPVTVMKKIKDRGARYSPLDNKSQSSESPSELNSRTKKSPASLVDVPIDVLMDDRIKLLNQIHCLGDEESSLSKSDSAKNTASKSKAKRKTSSSHDSSSSSSSCDSDSSSEDVEEGEIVDESEDETERRFSKSKLKKSYERKLVERMEKRLNSAKSTIKSSDKAGRCLKNSVKRKERTVSVSSISSEEDSECFNQSKRMEMLGSSSTVNDRVIDRAIIEVPKKNNFFKETETESELEITSTNADTFNSIRKVYRKVSKHSPLSKEVVISSCDNTTVSSEDNLDLVKTVFLSDSPEVSVRNVLSLAEKKLKGKNFTFKGSALERKIRMSLAKEKEQTIHKLHSILSGKRKQVTRIKSQTSVDNSSTGSTNPCTSELKVKVTTGVGLMKRRVVKIDIGSETSNPRGVSSSESLTSPEITPVRNEDSGSTVCLDEKPPEPVRRNIVFSDRRKNMAKEFEEREEQSWKNSINRERVRDPSYNYKRRRSWSRSPFSGKEDSRRPYGQSKYPSSLKENSRDKYKESISFRHRRDSGSSDRSSPSYHRHKDSFCQDSDSSLSPRPGQSRRSPSLDRHRKTTAISSYHLSFSEVSSSSSSHRYSEVERKSVSKWGATASATEEFARSRAKDSFSPECERWRGHGSKSKYEEERHTALYTATTSDSSPVHRNWCSRSKRPLYDTFDDSSDRDRSSPDYYYRKKKSRRQDNLF